MKTRSILLILISLVLQSSAHSQSNPKIDFLERKLTFNYYNSTQGMWWITTMKYNEESEIFRFKTVSAKNPAKIIGKKYTERSFKLEDLNPYMISTTPIEQDQGYMVKGQLIRLETVKHRKLVSKTINNARATPQSYIHFVIPQYLVDSLGELPLQIKESFQSLIEDATTIYRQESNDLNKELIFETLVGEFEVGETKRFAENHNENVIAFEEYKDRRRIKTGFIGYDQEADFYYELDVYETGRLMESRFHVDTTQQVLTLKGISHPERSIILENRSKVIYKYGEEEVVYRPSRSFN